jgi:hypothetical protein
MKTNATSFSVLGSLVLAALLIIGILKIQQVHAQVDATPSDAVATSSESTHTLDATTSTTSNSSVDTIAPDSTQTSASTAGLVEVQLVCSQSYTADLYDTPSGHVEFTSSSGANASSTSVAANIIGEQSWTVCHDARGHVHKFKITADEYAALRVRGMPQKSVMKAPDQAALDAFPVEAAAAPVAVTPTTPGSPSPEPKVLSGEPDRSVMLCAPTKAIDTVPRLNGEVLLLKGSSRNRVGEVGG